MANKIQKPCRVCKKMFTPCADCENDKTMFRWRKFTCSLNCAKEYFARIEETRKIRNESNIVYDNGFVLSDIADAEDIDNAENERHKKGKKKNIEIGESEQID